MVDKSDNMEVSVKLRGDLAREFVEIRDTMNLKTNVGLVKKLVDFYKVNSTAWNWIKKS